MTSRIPGLFSASHQTEQLPDGEYLVRVVRPRYRWNKHKPYYSIGFEVLEPKRFSDRTFTGRLYCTPKALWKLSWFLRDFGYDPELLGRDELDERALIKLTGVIKISHKNFDGNVFLNLDGFAPADRWPEISAASDSEPEVA